MKLLGISDSLQHTLIYPSETIDTLFSSVSVPTDIEFTNAEAKG